ncbi:OmpA family protein [Candidatus Macondimonas diazotrophica]|jgi:OOP family OmpA-OmpF porin|uniref:OmpA family protein n=1 Tax=Candidatus Macondimonas diazotrophica TaxID=2305248 RepID=A0A4Z0F728_9GAMM|nr:OmpA family protein [Candidatus Macondimonas diazotrophica]NCU01527.1 OmpA family protein [Candidatus Macondimonas diazotrophica]TFZ82099.1 OmpA family protein [Candidatus Macondimonas diazotrophica]HBG29197.1 cell envelope biogenesis protein OmpA [Gammaproteobacteria bacterium]HBG50648.1 cell envelope biogenesis protein OmpA [Gammaproteobacteria bacterium]
MKSQLKKLTGASALLLLAAPAAHAVVESGFVVSPGAVYQWFDDDAAGVEDDVGYRLGLGYQFTPHWVLELVGSRVDTEVEGADGVDFEMTQATLDLMYNFMPEWTVTPYALLSAGYAWYEADGFKKIDPNLEDFDEDEPVIGAGLGLKANLTDNLFARLDGRYVSYTDSNIDDYIAHLVIGYTFGEAAAPAPAPAPVMMEEPVDGDADGDGIPDSRDKCPGTSAGAKVDADGCYIIIEKPVTIRLEVLFDFDKSVVKPEYYPEIKKVADFMKQYPMTDTVIEGHTDSIGTNAYNLSLSQRRAEAVRQVLIDQFNVDASRLTSVGYGEERPIADNRTAEGRQLNRRVVAVVSATKKEKVRAE